MGRLRFALFLLIILFLEGCFENSSSPQQSAHSVDDSANSLLDVHNHYSNQRYTIALNAVDEFLAQQPSSAQALLLKGFILLRTGDSSGAQSDFSRIPVSERALMTDSCLELREIGASGKLAEVLQIARVYFPDCLSELSQPLPAVEGLVLSKQKIIFLGQLYDQAIRKEGDLQVRKKKEEDFLKKHGLSESQLGEITSRYLDYLAAQD